MSSIILKWWNKEVDPTKLKWNQNTTIQNANSWGTTIKAENVIKYNIREIDGKYE